MIIHYGLAPDGRAFPSSATNTGGYVYFQWDDELCVGQWVDRNGRITSSSHMHPGMSIFARFVRTHSPTLDRDYDMDEGL